MNVVQVNLIEDKYKKRYTYRVPDNIALSKNDVVMVENQNHSEHIAICVTDSEDLSNNAIDMIMGGTEVVSSVVGVYELIKFGENIEAEIDTSIRELDKRYFQQNTAPIPEI